LSMDAASVHPVAAEMPKMISPGFQGLC